jgi:hypothetical protein
MADIAAADVVTVTRINDKAGTIIAFLERATASSTFTTTEQPILRGDSIPVVSGRQYEITMTPTVYNSSVAADLIEVRARVAIGATATITSTHLGSRIDTANSGGGNQKAVGATWLYTPGSTGNLSLLISGIRTGGSGNCSIGSAASAYMLRIMVKDLGLAATDTGVDL